MKVREVMTKNPVTISPEATVNTAIDIMNKHHIWTLPIVTEGILIGVLTKQDIKYRMKEPSQKVSDIMSTPAFTISPDEELSVATEKLKTLRINALTVVEELNIVGILTRCDIYKKSLVKIGECHYCYPRGDRGKKELTQCNYCNNWFCTAHFIPKKPMATPFKSTEVDERKEWEKKGHPCVPYYDAIRNEEKYLRKETYQSYGNGKIKIEQPLPPEPELPTKPLPKPSSGKEIKPKIKEPITVEKKPLYKHSKKFISWFFWKKHPKNHLRKKPFLKNFSILIVISIIFWLIYSNIKSVNLTVFSYIKIGSLIEIILIIVFIYFLYKILVNLRYGIRGASNGTKMFVSIFLLIVCIFFLLNPFLLSQPFYNFNYETLNPLSTGSSQDVSIKNPSYSQMEQFISIDTTDSNEYVYYQYVCVDFSRDVINNAKNNGIRAAMVYLNEPNGFSGHAIVAFQTTDRGLYFVEPQLDVVFSEGQMENMLARGIYDIQTMYGGTYYQYTEYFNMQLTGYNIEYWNDNILQGTPGFEMVTLIGTLILLLTIKKRKTRVRFKE